MNGLTTKEVIESRKKYGSNTLTKIKRKSFLKLVLISLSDPIIKILLIVLSIKFIFLFKDFDWYETIGILIAVVLASLISALSEYGSEEAFKTLEEESSKQLVNVLRNGKITTISSTDIVVGDVVLLNSGSRIVDAIEAAGGVTDKANITKVNLVYILQDGMKINIPNQNDLKNNENFEYITMSSGDDKNDANINNSASNTSSEKSSSNKESAFKISVVNINTATQTELETLPGIGPSLALKIINYRKENGKFSSIEDIKNVSGIGDAKFENIKNYIRV